MVKPEKADMHRFLIAEDYELNGGGESIAKIRNYLSSRPETKAVFKMRDIPDVSFHKINIVHIEFCQAWPLPTRFKARVNRPGYVNPHYLYAQRYSDIYSKCKCGTTVTQLSPNGNSQIEDENQHGTTCESFDRLRSVADLKEQRYDEIRRLTRIGWRVKDLAKRFGCSERNVKTMVSKYNFRIRELRNDFRRIAGNTYIQAVQVGGVKAEEMAKVYGVTQSTLGRWKRKYADDIENDMEYRNDGNGFEWRKVKSAKTPDFLKSSTENEATAEQ